MLTSSLPATDWNAHHGRLSIFGEGFESLKQVASVTASHRAQLLRGLVICSTEPLEGVLQMPPMSAPGAPNIHTLDNLVAEETQSHLLAASFTDSLGRKTDLDIAALAVGCGGTIERFATLGTRFVNCRRLLVESPNDGVGAGTDERCGV